MKKIVIIKEVKNQNKDLCVPNVPIKEIITDTRKGKWAKNTNQVLNKFK
jgi:hypothetical protein